MAATSKVSGRYVAHTYKSWDSFTDQRSGEIVQAGASLLIHVVDDDGLLDTVKVPGPKVAETLPLVQALEFATSVTVNVVVNRYGLTFSSLEPVTVW